MAKTCRACGREFAGSETYCPDDGARLSTTLSDEDRVTMPFEAVRDPLIGVTLDGRYKILRAIGEGGMGVVYEALHVVIEKPVAVKVLRSNFTSRPDVVERFRQEAKSASRIGHPNIIDVSDFGETPSGASYIVMEMLHGEDLADILSRERVLAPARAVRLVYQVARALDATHRKSIVHRDLKPENIYLISVDGVSDVVKVVDFGVAKMSDLESTTGRRLTRTGMLFGTPEYMSPEQAAGKPFDHRVDIYALGAIAFELLTGRVPFEGENFMEILAKHSSQALPRLCDVNPNTRASEELEHIIARALAKEPNDRYPTMAELANELRLVPEMPGLNASETTSVPDWAYVPPAPPPAAVSPSTAPVERKRRISQLFDQRGVFWAGSAGLCLLIGLGVIVSRSVGGHPLSAPPAPAARAQSGVPVPASALALAARRSTTAPDSVAAVHDVNETHETNEANAVNEAHAAHEANAHVANAASPHAQLPQGIDSSVPAPRPLVELRVSTEPAGARVAVVGREREHQCLETPCSLSIPRGERLQLRATLGRATIKRRVSYAEDGELALRFATEEKPSGDQSSKATSSSDLKVPELFR
jgi:eukaryotic-like serine/threonine-protein kinase